MQLVLVIEDAPILVPNESHSNFTQSDKLFEKGVLLEGNPININGKRRGENFTYRLFQTNQNQLIHLNKVKPMNVTEVTLGSNGSRTTMQTPRTNPTPTIIKMPYADVLFTKKTITGSLLGAGIGFLYSKYQKAEPKKRNMFIGIGAVVGFAVSRYMERRNIIVKPSK